MIRMRVTLFLLALFVLVVCLASCASNNSSATPLRITTASLPTATTGVAYSEQLAAQGGKGLYAWSVAAGALPDGLTLESSGLLSGRPTRAGNFSFTVQVMDVKTQAKAWVQIQVRG